MLRGTPSISLYPPNERRSQNSETPTRATPPTESVIYAALGLPPRGTPSISLYPPHERRSQNSETPTPATPPQRNRSSMRRSAYPPGDTPLLLFVVDASDPTYESQLEG